MNRVLSFSRIGIGDALILLRTLRGRYRSRASIAGKTARETTHNYGSCGIRARLTFGLALDLDRLRLVVGMMGKKRAWEKSLLKADLRAEMQTLRDLVRKEKDQSEERHFKVETARLALLKARGVLEDMTGDIRRTTPP